MARSSSRSSGGGSRGSSSKSMFSTSSAPSAKSMPPPPAKSPPAPAPAPVQKSTGQSFLGNLGATMVEGAALGAGSTMGRMAVNAIFGGSSQHSPAESKQATYAASAPEPVKEYKGACAIDHSQLLRCMDDKNESDCTYHFSSLQQCLQNSKANQHEF